MNKLLAIGNSSTIGQVLRWKNDRVKVGGQKIVTFKELYEDYELWVSRGADQCILKKTSFIYYFYKIFRKDIESCQIRKTKRYPVTFENLEIINIVQSTDR